MTRWEVVQVRLVVSNAVGDSVPWRSRVSLTSRPEIATITWKGDQAVITACGIGRTLITTKVIGLSGTTATHRIWVRVIRTPRRQKGTKT